MEGVVGGGFMWQRVESHQQLTEQLQGYWKLCKNIQIQFFIHEARKREKQILTSCSNSALKIAAATQ